jgi:hypothetical protein
VLKWTAGSIAPLLLNHQCYYEALYVLYSRQEFFIYISDVGVTVRPQPRNHAWLASPAHPIPLWTPDSGLALISNLSIHVFVKGLDEACTAPIQHRIANLVRELSGRPLAILRIKITFRLMGHMGYIPLNKGVVNTRALLLLGTFGGLTAKRAFVELQGHWSGAMMRDWSRKLESLLRSEHSMDKVR